MDMKKKNQITAIIVFLLSIAGYYEAMSYPAKSAVFPKFIFIFALISAVVLFITSTLGLIKEENESKIEKPKKVFLVIFITVLYFILIRPVGYFIVTPIYLFLTSYFLNLKNIKALILYPIGFTIFLYIGFRILLSVPLPMGILG